MYKLSDKRYTTLILIILLAAGTIFFSKEVTSGVYKGIYFCTEVLVPSIFPFMVISAFTAKCGLSFSGKVFNRISHLLFGISAKTLFAVIIGILGGYPVAARGISTLYENGEISEKEAANASYIAVGAGPGFLITFIGARLLNCIEAGVILLISQIVSVIILGIINKIIFKKDNYNSDKEIKRTDKKLINIFTQSVSSAVYGAIEMCAVVCVFSALISISQKYFGENDYINILLEVTTACSRLSASGSIVPIAFAAGFGGISVHFQIFQALGKIKINILLFFFYRILQGAITASLTALLTKIFGITIPVFSGTQGDFTLGLSSSVIGSSLLILTGICFLFSIKTTN